MQSVSPRDRRKDPSPCSTEAARDAASTGPRGVKRPGWSKRGLGGVGSGRRPGTGLGQGFARGSQLLGDPGRRGAAYRVPRGERALDGEHLADAGREVRRDRGELVVGQVPRARCRAPRSARTQAPATSCATRNGTPCADQPLGDVGREREALRRELGHPVGVERAASRPCPVNGGQQHLERVDRVEDRLLVLLQVAVVGQRQRP